MKYEIAFYNLADLRRKLEFLETAESFMLAANKAILKEKEIEFEEIKGTASLLVRDKNVEYDKLGLLQLQQAFDLVGVKTTQP